MFWKAWSMSLFFLAPVRTNFPDTKISSTILGSIMRYTRPDVILTWEHFRLVAAKVFVLFEDFVQVNGELHIRTPDDVLNLELLELDVISQFLPLLPTWMIRAYLRAAMRLSFSVLAPVQTIFPDANTNAVVLGFLRRITTAANLLGLYSAFRACRAISFKLSGQSKFTVDTMFLLLEAVNWRRTSAVGYWSLGGSWFCWGWMGCVSCV